MHCSLKVVCVVVVRTVVVNAELVVWCLCWRKGVHCDSTSVGDETSEVVLYGKHWSCGLMREE